MFMFWNFFRQRKDAEAQAKANEILRRKVMEMQTDLDLEKSIYNHAVKDNGQLQEMISQRDDMLRICRDGRLQAEKDAKAHKDALIIATFKLNSAIEAIKIFADRYKISATELRQLQVADLLPAQEDNQGFERATASFAPFESGDALTLLNAGNDFKQTSGKFRQLRQNFVTLQLALTKMFDGLERQAKKKPVTISQLRDVRQQASDAIGRKV